MSISYDQFIEKYGKSFCIKPFTEIANTVGGNMSLCCKYSDTIQIKDENTYKDFFYNNQYLKNIRKRMLEGKPIKGCTDCIMNEEVNRSSMRFGFTSAMIKRYPDIVDNAFTKGLPELKTLDIKFGNKCNLGCVMCNSISSSFIHNERKKHGIPKKLDWTTGKISNFNDTRFDQLKEISSSLVSIKSTGGEPTLLPGFKKWINYLIKRGYSKNIDYMISTNGTTDLSLWVEDFAKFKTFIVIFSHDAVGDLFEYVRYPAKFSKMQNNHEKFYKKIKDNDFTNVQIGFNMVLHALNVHQLPEVYDYFNQYQNSLQSFEVATYPYGLQPGIVSKQTIDTVKEKLAKRFKKSKNIDNCLNDLDQQFKKIHSRDFILKSHLTSLETMTKYWKKTRNLDVTDFVVNYHNTISQ